MNPGDPTLRKTDDRRSFQTVAVSVVDGPDHGKSVTGGDRITVGTALDNDLVLTDPTASRYHVELTRRGRDVLIRDLASTNGTAIGRVRVAGSFVLASPGTTMQLGDSTLCVEEGDELVEAPSVPSSLSHIVARSNLMRRVLADVAVEGSPVAVYRRISVRLLSVTFT